LASSRTNLHVNFKEELKKLEKRIDEIISTDLTELEEEMEEKSEQQHELIKAESVDSEKINRLGDEV